LRDLGNVILEKVKYGSRGEERENKRKGKWMLEPHLSVEVITRRSIAKFSPKRFQQYQEMLPSKPLIFLTLVLGWAKKGLDICTNFKFGP
jgi:hypothetical protein